MNTITRPTISKTEIQQKLLNVLCSNSGECITFGRFTEVLEEYFENMDFKYLINPITRIGKPSVNGFVNELIFQKEQYKIYTILKSTIQSKSDNLLYEYIVGYKYINSLLNKFPCFLETYGLYSYSSKNVYNTLLENKINNSNIIKNHGLILRDYNLNANNIIKSSCDDPRGLCILIQYIETPITLHDFLSTNYNNAYTIDIDLLQILLQIYLPLAKLMVEFSHNDLHTNNILLYKVPNNQYIEMTYQLEDLTEIKFKTKYIVKIIDYGRCYFNNIRTNYSSKTFYDKMKTIAKCREHEKVGYKWFVNEVDYENFYISSLVGNPSKDLWLAYIITVFVKKFIQQKTPSIKASIVEDLIEVLIVIQKNDKYAGLTLDEIITRCPKPAENIYSCNVFMFTENLIHIYKKHQKYFQDLQTQNFTENSCLGKMIIYTDLTKDMDFQLTYTTSSEPPLLSPTETISGGKTKKHNKIKRNKKRKIRQKPKTKKQRYRKL